jgi:hypothetical protein
MFFINQCLLSQSVSDGFTDCSQNIYRSPVPGLNWNPDLYALYGIAAQGRDDRLTF